MDTQGSAILTFLLEYSLYIKINIHLIEILTVMHLELLRTVMSGTGYMELHRPRESLFYLMMSLEHIDFYIIG